MEIEPQQIIPPAPEGLAWAHPLVRDWFISRFGTPTEPQEQGWPHILAGRTTLISAPTGSGKTLAAFLACIDRLVRKALAGELQDRTEVLYVSPLKALSNDIQKNLEAPLGEILQLAGQRGLLMPQIRTAVRTGDTLAHERRAMLSRPPHILVTTPESLYILLTADQQPRNSENGRNGNRRRNSRRRRRQARRASRFVTRAPRTPHPQAAHANRPFRHAESHRAGRRISGRGQPLRVAAAAGNRPGAESPRTRSRGRSSRAANWGR